MNGMGKKLLDFTGIMEYRVGKYYPVPFIIPNVKEKGREVSGYGKE